MIVIAAKQADPARSFGAATALWIIGTVLAGRLWRLLPWTTRRHSTSS